MSEKAYITSVFAATFLIGFPLGLPSQDKKEASVKVVATAEEVSKEYNRGRLVDPRNATLEEKLNEKQSIQQAIKAADTKYRHKTLELTGVVFDFGQIQKSSGLYVSFEVSGTIPIHANFFSQDAEAMAFAKKLRKGDEITVLGSCGGYSSTTGVVGLGRCKGIKVKPRELDKKE